MVTVPDCEPVPTVAVTVPESVTSVTVISPVSTESDFCNKFTACGSLGVGEPEVDSGRELGIANRFEQHKAAKIQTAKRTQRMKAPQRVLADRQ
jgi:hypothetical protein